MERTQARVTDEAASGVIRRAAFMRRSNGGKAKTDAEITAEAIARMQLVQALSGGLMSTGGRVIRSLSRSATPVVFMEDRGGLATAAQFGMAFTDFESVYLNRNRLMLALSEAVSIEDPIESEIEVAQVLTSTYGAMKHEMCHILYTPRFDSTIMAHVRALKYTYPNIMYVWNMIEDARIEMLYTMRYPTVKHEFTVMVARWVLMADIDDPNGSILATAFPLVHGRKYLPAKLRNSLEEMFDANFPHATERVKEIIDEYVRSNPHDDAKAQHIAALIGELHGLLFDKPEQGNTPSSGGDESTEDSDSDDANEEGDGEVGAPMDNDATAQKPVQDFGQYGDHSRDTSTENTRHDRDDSDLSDDIDQEAEQEALSKALDEGEYEASDEMEDIGSSGDDESDGDDGDSNEGDGDDADGAGDAGDEGDDTYDSVGAGGEGGDESGEDGEPSDAEGDDGDGDPSATPGGNGAGAGREGDVETVDWEVDDEGDEEGEGEHPADVAAEVIDDTFGRNDFADTYDSLIKSIRAASSTGRMSDHIGRVTHRDIPLMDESDALLGEARRQVAAIGRELKALRASVDPLPERKLRRGRLDMRRVIGNQARPVPSVDVFTKVVGTDDRNTGIDLVIGGDMSGSMYDRSVTGSYSSRKPGDPFEANPSMTHPHAQADLASWIIKSAMDNLNMPCVYFTYSYDSAVAYEATEKAPRVPRTFFSNGGTEPTNGIIAARSFFQRPDRNANQVLVMFTDGSFNSNNIADPALQLLLDDGVYVIFFYIGDVTYGGRGHPCSVSHDIESPMEMVPHIRTAVRDITRIAVRRNR